MSKSFRDESNNQMAREGTAQTARQTRLAVTVPNPQTGIYPAKSEQPNTYWIAFVDGDYPSVQGKQVHTLNLRQCPDKARMLAHNIVEGEAAYCEKFTLVQVTFENIAGAEGKQKCWFAWWGAAATPGNFSNCPSNSWPSDSGDSGSSGGSSGASSGISSGGSSGASSGASSAAPSGGSSGAPSEGPSSGQSSAKSTAIVPAGWSPTGYTALFIAECPEVRFDDVIVAHVSGAVTRVPIDPKYLEVCEKNSVRVCGCVPDLPVPVGAAIEEDAVCVRLGDGCGRVRVVIRLTGIRKGFRGHRFPDRTRAQFEANERFINSAYDNE